MEYLEKVPMEVNQIKYGETEKRIITDDEFKKVLIIEPNSVLQAYYRLAYSCGLRIIGKFILRIMKEIDRLN
tara:strand:+ start:384 stop:599 length:216 start_codon:yes stop_codon:yes gene_type:complete